MRGWFGAKFDTPMYEGLPEVDYPEGQKCLMCQEPVVAPEPGLLMHYLDEDGPGLAPVHFECELRSILGGPTHLDGKCSCFTGKHYDSGMTYREEARETVRRYWGDNWIETAVVDD